MIPFLSLVPSGGLFFERQRIAPQAPQETARGREFRLSLPLDLLSQRPKEGACGPPPLDSSPGCSTTLLRCSVLTSSRTKHSIVSTLFVLNLTSQRRRTDSTPNPSCRRWPSERRHFYAPKSTQLLLSLLAILSLVGPHTVRSKFRLCKAKAACGRQRACGLTNG